MSCGAAKKSPSGAVLREAARFCGAAIRALRSHFLFRRN
jgi:hypothetical protein